MATQPFNHVHGTHGGKRGSSHGRRLVLLPGRPQGKPGGSGPVLAVAGPAAISEQGAVHRQQPVVDEEEMGGEGEGSGISSRARARPVARPALFSPVAMEWQECTYAPLLLNLPDSSHPCVSSWDASPIFNLFLGLWVEFMQHFGSQ